MKWTTALAALLVSVAIVRPDDPSAKPSPEERERLSKEIAAKHAEVNKAYAAGKLADALAAAEQATAIARRLYPKTDYPDGHGQLLDCLRFEAAVCQGAKRHADAERLFGASVAMARRVHKNQEYPALANDMNRLAMAMIAQGKLAEAEPVSADALAMARRVVKGEDQLFLANCLTMRGQLLAELGRPADAAPLLREALEVSRRVFGQGDHPRLVICLCKYAGVLGALGKADDAVAMSGDGVAMARRLSDGRDHPHVADALANRAQVLADVGRPADAEPVAREALDMHRRLAGGKDGADVALALRRVGKVLGAAQKEADAEPFLKDSVAMFRRLAGPAVDPVVATGLIELSTCQQILGKLTDAEAAARAAVEGRRRAVKGADDRYLAGSLNRLGQVLAAEGKRAAAVPLLREALDMDRRLYHGADDRTVSGDLIVLAGLLIYTGDLEGAEKLARQALDMDRRLSAGAEGERVVKDLNTLGIALLHQRQPAEAQRTLGEALEMNRRLRPGPDGWDAAATRFNLGLAYQVGHKLDSSEASLRGALEAFRRLVRGQDHPAVSRTLALLASVLDGAGKPKEALPALREALAMHRRLAFDYAWSRPEGDVLNMAANYPVSCSAFLTTARKLGLEPADAYAAVWPAKAVLSQVFERRHLMARAMAADPKVAALLNARTEARRRRADLLIAPLPRTDADRGARDAELERLNRTIARLDREIRPALSPLERAERLDKAGPADLQKALPADAAFVDFFKWSDEAWNAETKTWDRTERYQAFVVRPDRVGWVDLGSADEIERAIEPWRRAIVSGKPVTAALGATARATVWAKVRAEVPGTIRIVYLAPDAALSGLPWVALPGDKPGTVLLEDMAVAVVPHGPFLLDQMGPRDVVRGTPRGMLAVGGVDFDAGRGEGAKFTWPALPGTAAEARGVSAAATAAKIECRTLLKDAATVDAVLAELPKARYAHLATHGFVADSEFRTAFGADKSLFLTQGSERVGAGKLSPLVTVGLALAGANRPDAPGRGLLTGEAIVDRDLSGLDLAVLSACETGVGEQAGRGGETTFALQQAFHLAGARTVIASLWKVDDQATAALMSEFYRRLWDPKQPLPPVEALRQAQLTIYKNPGKLSELARTFRGAFETVPGTTSDVPVGPANTTHPRLWAAFVLSGRGQ